MNREEVKNVCLEEFNKGILNKNRISIKYNIPYTTLTKWINNPRIETQLQNKWCEEEINLLKNTQFSTLKELQLLLPYKRKNNIISKKLYQLGILKEGDTKRLHSNGRKVYIIDDNYFNKQSSNMFYILGVIASDGHIEKDRFNIVSKDRDMLEKIQKELNSNCPIKEYTKDKYTFSIYNYKLAKQILKYLPLDKTFNLKFPDIPKQFEKDFIRGLIDGDGCINKYKGYPRISFVGTYDVAKRLNEIFNNLSGSISKVYSGKTKKGIMIYRVSYVAHKALLILDYIYKDAEIYMDRKYKVYQSLKNYKFIKYKEPRVHRKQTRDWGEKE